VSGLPKVVAMRREHVREALSGVLVEIVALVKRELNATPPELVNDIAERGMVLCGGGSLLEGLDQLVAHETLMPVCVANEPLTCVAKGAGTVLRDIDKLSRVLVRCERVRAIRH
jgi:rod shape-determining protein MreB